MMRRILVPLDGSTRAEGALLPAAQLARKTGGSLFLVRATLLPTEYAWISADTTMILADALEADQKSAHDYLNQVTTFPCLEGLEVATSVVQGDPATAILEYVQQEEADLIVMCRHGKGDAKRWEASPKRSCAIARSRSWCSMKRIPLTCSLRTRR
ncbi:universal stress protein [Ktedonobacter sp. SOSP1-85]|uniref:universal stress protein n=1 Tax=Ktedonobacter sp. SOSP1-85 TaxID=2778367 RepID=UPI00191602DF|nr:universal stress protein [Ktedonobacter sp. SOSP1-85]GHO77659.1 universal stress protein [Ktedonobacter sp. SOSP1-85]